MSDDTPTSEIVDATADVEDAVNAAAGALRGGGLVVLPTDTVYGVAADAFNPGATDKIFLAKRRPRRYPLPVLIRSPKQLIGLVPEVSDQAENLMAAYWPGPLTIVVRTDPNLAWDLGRNEGTVAVRMPMDDVTLAVIRAVGPIAVTSANLSGQTAATTARLAQGQLGDAVEVYVDGGRRASTEPSTIVDLTRRDPAILRSGPLDDDEVLQVARGELAPHLAGQAASGDAADKPISPGGPAETTPDDGAAAAVTRGDAADVDDETVPAAKATASAAAATSTGAAAASHRAVDHRAVDHRAATPRSRPGRRRGRASRRSTADASAAPEAADQSVETTPAPPDPGDVSATTRPAPPEPSVEAEEHQPPATPEPAPDANPDSADEPAAPRRTTHHIARDHRAGSSGSGG